MLKPKRKFGFPLFMFVGFYAGASVAVAIFFALTIRARSLNYSGLFSLVLALGWVGAHTGHMIGAAKYKDAGFKPTGPLTPGAFMAGTVIVLSGSIAVVILVLSVMSMVKGPPPH